MPSPHVAAFASTLAVLVALTTMPVFSGVAASEPAAQPPMAERAAPKLIVVIAVDQFSADLFAEYRSRFTGGLARLAEGVVFPAGYQAHAATETCPGHATILSGAHPAHTGIVANYYFNPSAARSDKRVYCAEDETVSGTASASGDYVPSAIHLRVPTLGERMKTAVAGTQVVAVAGKDRAAIMMAGRRADETLWLAAPSGLASYRQQPLSIAAQHAATAIAATIAAPQAALPLPAQCAARDIAIDLGNGRTVGNGRLARAGGDFNGFLASPQADRAVLELATALRAERKLGEAAATDLLIVGLSATDYVGHAYGTQGAEMCLQLIALDRMLGDFLASLDATGVDYLVVLTADHGGQDLPERNRQNAATDAQRVDPALLPDRLGKAIAETLDLPQPLLFGDGPFGDYYLDKRLTPAQRAAVLAQVSVRLAKHPQVAAVFTAAQLQAIPIARKSPELWTLAERVRASFDPTRSGDFIVVLKPRVTPIPDPRDRYIATHGSPWDNDRRVPIVFWRKGMTGFEQPNPVMSVDIVPTLAALIGLPVDRDNIDGRCLDLEPGATSTCPQ